MKFIIESGLLAFACSWLKRVYFRGELYTLPLREYKQDHQVELSGAPKFIENYFEKGFCEFVNRCISP